MRRFYTILFYIAIPLILLRLLWRSRVLPAYRQRWRERFGFFPALPQSGCVWLHAVSLGEVRAALPLIRALQERYRSIPLLISTTTPTGSQQVRDSLGDSVHHVYLPYDLPASIRRFLLRAKPRLVVIMETELWPNLLYICQQSAVPVVIANARLSERSVRRYTRFPRFSKTMLDAVTLIAAQSRLDAIRFNDLGASTERLRIVGNIKYDMTLPEGLRQQGDKLRARWFGQRLVLIAASTHSGEDEQVLTAYQILRAQFDDLVLVLVPRHPERFKVVAELCQRCGFTVHKRSDQSKSAQKCEADVFLGDSIGELLLFYAAADIAFVGGSLVAKGGHNILEPALLGLPIVFGPHMYNFNSISQHLLQQQAAWQVNDATALADCIAQLVQQPSLRQLSGQRAQLAVDSNRGALERLFTLLEDKLEAEPPSRGILLSVTRLGQTGSTPQKR